MATLHDAQCVIVAWSHGTSFLLAANAGRQHSRHIKKGSRRKKVEQPRIKSFRGQPTKNKRKSIRGQPKKGRIQSFRWLPKKGRRLAEQKRVCSCLLVHSFLQTVTVWLMFRQYTNKTVDLSIIMKMIVQYWEGHGISVASIVGLLYMLDFLPKTCCSWKEYNRHTSRSMLHHLLQKQVFSCLLFLLFEKVCCLVYGLVFLLSCLVYHLEIAVRWNWYKVRIHQLLMIWLWNVLITVAQPKILIIQVSVYIGDSLSTHILI